MCSLTAAAVALTMNIYHEARSEGVQAMMAVAEVTMNRVEDTRFPNNVCDVVYQTQRDYRGNPKIDRCHFSWYCDGKSDKMHNKELIATAEMIAIDYLTGLKTNFTKGATHYHASYVKPYWTKTKKKTTQIGSHIFYTWD